MPWQNRQKLYCVLGFAPKVAYNKTAPDIGAVLAFMRPQGRRFFFIQFSLRGKGGNSFASFALCLGLRGLQMCLHLCDGC